MPTLLLDIHPMIVHFPIALLFLGVILSFASRWYPNLDEITWYLLLFGGIMTIPAIISGLISHIPYEELAVYEKIEKHEYLAFATTFLFWALIFWRWRSRRKGNDIGHSWLFLSALAIGGAMIFFVGLSGGDLVYEFGVNVRGINPLFER